MVQVSTCQAKRSFIFGQCNSGMAAKIRATLITGRISGGYKDPYVFALLH